MTKIIDNIYDDYKKGISQLQTKNENNPDWKMFAYESTVYRIKKYIRKHYGDAEAENPCYDIYSMAKYIIDKGEKETIALKKSLNLIFEIRDEYRGINMDYNGKEDMNDRKN